MKRILALGLAMMTTTAFAQSYDSSSSEYKKASANEDLDAQEMQDNSWVEPDSTEAQFQEENTAAAASATGTTPMADAGNRHMFEFNLDSSLAAALSFDKVKTRGQDSDNDTNWALSGNYFYGVHRLLQAGFRFDYFNGVAAVEDVETMMVDIGAYLNSNEDFSRSMFIGAFVGAGWAQQFGDNSSRDDLRQATLSVGKRFPLSRWGIKHVTWTPELALKYQNSTTDQSLDYTQSLQFRILQF